MKKGYCHIDGKVYTDNFPGRCALPAETFLIFRRNRPYGPQGPWAQPLFDCVAVPSGGFFPEKKRPEQNNAYLLKK